MEITICLRSQLAVVIVNVHVFDDVQVSEHRDILSAASPALPQGQKNGVRQTPHVVNKRQDSLERLCSYDVVRAVVHNFDVRSRHRQ